jgi:hypothetical protein
MLHKGGRTFNFFLFYNDTYPEFEAANGFLYRVDYREGGGFFQYNFRSPTSFFQLIQPSVDISKMFNHEGKVIQGDINPQLSIQTRGNNDLSIKYNRQFEEFFGFQFYKNIFMVDLTNRTLPWMFANASVYFGDGIYYDAINYGIDPFLGYSQSISFQL